MARDKNKDELQTKLRDAELRQEAQNYKEEINLPEQEFRGMDSDRNEDRENEKR